MNQLKRPWLALSVLALLAGCPGPEESIDAATPTPDTGLDARRPNDAASPPRDARMQDAFMQDAFVVRCTAPQVNCGGVCVDPTSDPDHCGACDTACDPGLVCSSSTCAVSCAEGQLDCAGRCVNAATDNAHCGMCDNACPAGNVCTAGVCTVSCVAGQNVCSGACRDLQSDVNHCGACDNACAAGEVCSMGTCAASCGSGLTDCSGSCVATTTDPSHCGSCTNVCGLANVATQSCAASTCLVGVCGTGYGDCDGRSANGCETDLLSTDVNNCGGCGVRCAYANAGAVCAAGVCGLGTCAAGFADCDGSAANGCEVNLNTDGTHCGSCATACPASQLCSMGLCGESCTGGTRTCGGGCVNISSDTNHCGGCDQACALANVSVQACSASSCVVGACSTGFGDCDGTASNGCEVNVRATDVNNCGGCGIRCAFANAGATCTAGSCGLGTCAAGFSDCDGIAANGCETNTNADNGNCGGCGLSCSDGRVCSAGACARVCPMGTTACSGACVSTATDPNNCSACDSVCALSNVSVNACVASSCIVGSCTAGFADCDGTASNGCEINVRASDANNCGACGNRCSFTNASASCTAGSCALAACNAGFADCDMSGVNGCEINTQSDNNNCGGCGTVCGAGRTCSGGMCRSACSPGERLCGTTCANLSTSSLNCGGCGTACAAGQVCSAGGCLALTAGTGRAGGSLTGSALPRVAVLGASSSGTDLQTKLQAVRVGGVSPFAVVDFININSAPPTLATMQTYDAVAVYTYLTVTAAFATNLRAYLESGGGVVYFDYEGQETGTYAMPAPYQGTYNLMPLIASTAYSSATVTLGTVLDAASPLMAGVTTMRIGSTGGSHMPVSAVPRAGTNIVANWSDGAPAVMWATINGRRVVELNMFGLSTAGVSTYGWDATTDIARLIANSLVFTVPPAAVTTATTLDFGNQTNFTPSGTRTLTYTNASASAVTLTALNVTGTHIGDFAVTPSAALPATIPAGGTFTVDVVFQPSGLGLRGATLSAVTSVGTLTTSLRGTGI